MTNLKDNDTLKLRGKQLMQGEKIVARISGTRGRYGYTLTGCAHVSGFAYFDDAVREARAALSKIDIA